MHSTVLATQSKSLHAPLENVASTAVSGKADDQFRKILLKSQVLEGASGSSYVELGGTKVICSVNGPKESNSDSQEGSINVAVSGIDQCNRLTIQSALSSIVCVKKIARAEVDVELSVLADDGGAVAASLMAACMALTSANVECFDVLLACHFLVRGDGTCILDPDAKRIVAERAAISGNPRTEECPDYDMADITDIVSKKMTGGELHAVPFSVMEVTMAIAPSLGQVVFVDAGCGAVDKNLLKKAIRFGFNKCLELYPVMSKNLHSYASNLL